jgi:hypothetical protein
VGDECGTSRVGGRSHASVGEQLMMDGCAIGLLLFSMLPKFGKPVFFIGFLIHHTNILQSCCSYHNKKIDECST